MSVKIDTRNYPDNSGWVNAAEGAIQDGFALVIINFDSQSHLAAASALAAEYEMQLEFKNDGTECWMFVPNPN